MNLFERIKLILCYIKNYFVLKFKTFYKKLIKYYKTYSYRVIKSLHETQYFYI